MTALVWFRRDLRLADNLALAAAARHGKLLPLFFLDDEDAGSADDEWAEWATGAASRVWLHDSLAQLRAALQAAGADLYLPQGRAAEALPAIAQQTAATALFFQRRHEPRERAREAAVCRALAPLPVHAFDGAHLRPPDSVATLSGAAYKVFTPFYRNYLDAFSTQPPDAPLSPPAALAAAVAPPNMALRTLPPPPKWGQKILSHWQTGEAAASKTARLFSPRATQYAAARDFPAQDGTSRLSAHLHFGEISPRQLWASITQAGGGADHPFLRQLVWRDFSTHLLHHFPQFPDINWKREFDAFPWQEDAAALTTWQQGETGIPIIDAAMRQLWQTGHMHNRCRMIVASFLIKNLLLHWRGGQKWFWDCLLDADLGNNSAGWQWVAGSGADAAPYFRVFNPVLQSIKFDPQGDYLATYLPQLRPLPAAARHQPWTAGGAKNYPPPMVDLAASRRRALAAYASMKTAAQDLFRQ